MSRHIKSSAVLAFARFTNYSLLILSPILLVRILDPTEFGQYREFMAYAMLLVSVAAFSIPTNLLYFIPHSPDDTPAHLSHTNWLLLVASAVVCVAIWIFREPLLANTGSDFVLPLVAYVFLFVNLSYLESYWLAKNQPKFVFLFSTIRTIVRLAVVIGTAALTQSVSAILTALIWVEVARILAVIVIVYRLDLFSFRVDPQILKKQLTFVVPLGLASSLHFLNEYIGHIAISAQLGVQALAIYAIGSYQVPILNIVRSAISDAIFPDMVREAAQATQDRLRLWRKANVAYSFIIAPAFVGLAWFADVFIPIVFTAEYSQAVPIFRILAFVMVVQCFEFSSAIRAVNKNRALLSGNVLMVIVNFSCIFIFFKYIEDFAIFGPAIGIILGYLAQKVYLAWCITRTYSVGVRDLLQWRSLAMIYSSAAISCILLALGERLPFSELENMLLVSPVYCIAYFFLVRRARIDEVESVVSALTQRLQQKLQ